jgi:aminoacyl tRNA synthase complex-interacting multifunctional protein 1
MSSTDVFSKLSSPLRELLISSTQQDHQQLGVSEKDQTEVAQWIQKAAQPDLVRSDAFSVCHKFIELLLRFNSSAQSLDAHLVPRTYLVSNYLTAADIAVYGALRPIFVRRMTPNRLQTWTLL